MSPRFAVPDTDLCPIHLGRRPNSGPIPELGRRPRWIRQRSLSGTADLGLTPQARAMPPPCGGSNSFPDRLSAFAGAGGSRTGFAGWSVGAVIVTAPSVVVALVPVRGAERERSLEAPHEPDRPSSDSPSEKVEESREFAADVQRSLHGGLAAKNPGLRDRGVKKAPFVVLIGANMPSILAEISFVSNPGDEKRLRTAEYRQRIAESLYRGIAKYVSGLSGVKVASRIEKSQGQ